MFTIKSVGDPYPPTVSWVMWVEGELDGEALKRAHDLSYAPMINHIGTVMGGDRERDEWFDMIAPCVVTTISKVVDHLTNEVVLLRQRAVRASTVHAETLAEEMNVNAENTKDLAKYQKKLKNATRHIDEKNDIIAKHQKEQSENHQEDLASNRAYSVALLEKYQKKLKNAAMKLDEKNDIIAKQQKHSRRIHDLIAKQQKELAEKNELISAIRKRLCPQPVAVTEELSAGDSDDDPTTSKKQERKGVTFEHVQTEQLVYATTDEGVADDTTPRTQVTDAVYTCHEYDEYDELDYDPGLADIIAYINDDDTRFSFVLPVATKAEVVTKEKDEDEDEGEDEVEVRPWVAPNGTTYLKTEDGWLYDVFTHEIMGEWDDEKNEVCPPDDEEDEDEDEDEGEDEVEAWYWTAPNGTIYLRTEDDTLFHVITHAKVSGGAIYATLSETWPPDAAPQRRRLRV